MCIRDRMRDYNELKEMLVDMKYLPVKIESEDCFDDTCLNNNNLLYEEKITDLIMNIADGDLTDVLNVDLVYDYYGKMNKQKFYGYYTQDNCIPVSYTHLDVYKRQNSNVLLLDVGFAGRAAKSCNRTCFLSGLK